MSTPERTAPAMSSPAGASSPDGPVVLLAGGLSHERDVSLRSGRRSAEALRAVGVEVVVRDVDAHLLAALADDRPSAVLPMLHGAPGEDGAIRDVLELLGLPYVGSRPEPCRLSFDKPVAKAVLARAGALTPPAVALPHQTFRELGASAVLAAVVARLGLPLVVKPARGGSALGVTVVREPGALPEAMMACFAYGETALVERHIEGVELAGQLELGGMQVGLGAGLPRGVDLVTGHKLLDAGSARATLDLSVPVGRVLPHGRIAARVRWSDAIGGVDPTFARPSFATVALEASTVVAGTRAVLAVRNLFNSDYREPLSFIPEPGRTFAALLRRDFDLARKRGGNEP